MRDRYKKQQNTKDFLIDFCYLIGDVFDGFKDLFKKVYLYEDFFDISFFYVPTFFLFLLGYIFTGSYHIGLLLYFTFICYWVVLLVQSLSVYFNVK